MEALLNEYKDMVKQAVEVEYSMTSVKMFAIENSKHL